MSNESMRLLRNQLLELDKRREEIMTKVQEAMEFLEATPAGLNEPLIDDEGFPRDDCDLYAVRQARQTVNCGKNDLKAIELEMQNKLALLHEGTHDEAEMRMQRDDEERQKNGRN